MACKGTRVTEKEKRQMWLWYQELGNYTLVAKKMKRSRDTVSKYVNEYEAASKIAQILR